MAIKTCNPSGMGWEEFSPEGSVLAEVIVWSGVSIRQKLEALEELCDMGRRSIENRKRLGLPYIDPDTGEAVRPAR